MTWRWQNDYLWQSCTDATRDRAAKLVADKDAVYGGLRKLAARQPLVAFSADHAAIAHCQEHARALRQLSNRLVVVGTGGASLGANTLCALAPDPSRVRFLENCDPVTLGAFQRIERETTSWCIISKSGETVETLANALALIAHYQGHEKDLARRVRVITAVPESTLGKLARAQGWPLLAHPAELGGRYSAFSIVGMLPALYAGIDILAVAEDAQQAVLEILDHRNDSLLEHASWFAASLPEKPMHVLMAYADRLRPATQWYKQLWAESLGKDGRGATPVTAIGAIDQHSQLQLYLDGPRDKLVTLWLPETATDGIAFPQVATPGLEFLAGRHMGDVMHATAEAAATTLAKAGVPLRVLRGPLNPLTLAQWMARQMMETLLVAQLIGVDPYSQPAVEEGKRLTRAALSSIKEKRA